MAKTVIKETLIVILLIVVIMVLLAILLYDYIPTNKTLPKEVQAYEMPQEINEELKATVSQKNENIIKTYYIDSSDLSVYESKKDYDKGKVNPFQEYSEDSNGVANNIGSNKTSSSNSTSKNSNNTSSTGSYFNNSGKM